MDMRRVGTMINLLLIGPMIWGAAAEDMAKTDTTDSCPPVPHDVLYIVDTSISIKKAQFQLMRNALASMAKSFNIGPGPHDTRLAMVGFGRVSERYFDFKFGTDEASVIEHIQNMNRVHDSRGTRTHLGIQKMIETFEGDHGSRSDAQHLSIVFTDGRSTKPKSLATSLEALATKNITQYAVGIGQKIKKEELKKIALGNDNHVILAEDFDALGGIASDLVKHVSCICDPVCKRGKCLHSMATCECPPQWKGVDCDEPDCDPECVHGTCNRNTLTCDCDKDFKGSDCNESAICDPVCKHGTCTPSTGVCECSPQWKGVDCDEPICDPECIHGTCNRSTFGCDCDATYTGISCNESTVTVTVVKPAPKPTPRGNQICCDTPADNWTGSDSAILEILLHYKTEDPDNPSKVISTSPCSPMMVPLNLTGSSFPNGKYKLRVELVSWDDESEVISSLVTTKCSGSISLTESILTIIIVAAVTAIAVTF